MGEFDPTRADALRAQCQVRQPILAVEVKVTLAGITPAHWRRLVLPAAWSLRASAELMCLAFHRPFHRSGGAAIAFFEVTGSTPGSVVRHWCGVEGTRAASQRSASLNDILTPDLTRVTLVQGDAPPEWSASESRQETIDPAWFTSAAFGKRCWRWDVHVESLHMEDGEAPIPRAIAGGGCRVDRVSTTLEEFRERVSRWRGADAAPIANPEDALRAECGDPDRADLPAIDALMQEFAAPIWRRMKRLSM